tara:strand:+ start:157 stop:531 length:375 start_codon:yes stop_codon:yes gene_type:complete
MPYKDKQKQLECVRKNRKKKWKQYNHTTPHVYSIEFPDGAIYYGYTKQRYRFGQHFTPKAKWTEASNYAFKNGYSKEECVFTKLFICDDVDEVKRWEATIIFSNVDDPLMLNTTIPRPPILVCE